MRQLHFHFEITDLGAMGYRAMQCAADKHANDDSHLSSFGLASPSTNIQVDMHWMGGRPTDGDLEQVELHLTQQLAKELR